MMPGMPDLQALLQQAQQMQADMAQAQSDLAQVEVTGHAGGGLVTATVSGDGQLKALVIDPSVVDPADVETLADLIVAAVRDAAREAAEVAERSLTSASGMAGAGGPGGFDLSAFGLPSLDGVIDDDDDVLDDEFADDDDDDLEDDDLEDDDAADDLEEEDLVDADGAPLLVTADGTLDTEELNDMVDADIVGADEAPAGGATATASADDAVDLGTDDRSATVDRPATGAASSGIQPSTGD